MTTSHRDRWAGCFAACALIWGAQVATAIFGSLLRWAVAGPEGTMTAFLGMAINLWPVVLLALVATTKVAKDPEGKNQAT